MFERNALPLKKHEAYKKTKLIFNGGGTKGIAHPMAFAAFIACGGNLNKITDVVGTSVGSIMACFVASGYNLQELPQELSKNFMEFLDEEPGVIKVSKKASKTISKWQNSEDFTDSSVAIGPLVLAGPTIKSRIKNNMGIFKGEALYSWIEEMIAAKTDIQFCTFMELHKLTQKNHAYKDLHVATLNANTQVIEYFDYLTNPDAIISDVVCASSTLPLFFEPRHIRIKDKNGDIESVADKDKYLDGGIIDNYPINHFHNQLHASYESILGFYLCDSAVARYLRGQGELPRTSIDSSSDLIQSFVRARYNQQYSQFMADEQAKACTVAIDNMGVSTIDFNLNEQPEKLISLLRSGWEASCSYFDLHIPFPEAEFSRQDGSFQDYVLRHHANNTPVRFPFFSQIKPTYYGASVGIVALVYFGFSHGKPFNSNELLFFCTAVVVLATLIKGYDALTQNHEHPRSKFSN